MSTLPDTEQEWELFQYRLEEKMWESSSSARLWSLENVPCVSQLAPGTKDWDNNQPQVSWEVIWCNTDKLLDITTHIKMVTTNNNTEMITWMNATTKLGLEPFLFKPLFSTIQTCNSAAPVRIPQSYFQSLLSSVSLSWTENKKIGKVLCCIYTRHTTSYMRSDWFCIL